jgi:hypothetical protein
VDRWVQRHRKDVEAGNRTASHLAVQYPADLAWSGVTCHVLDTKTLQQKQAKPLPLRLHAKVSLARPGRA